jgi:hypothetical protein
MSEEQILEILKFLAPLIRIHGAGEYILRVRADGSATVKIPREPLRYDHPGGGEGVPPEADRGRA